MVERVIQRIFFSNYEPANRCPILPVDIRHSENAVATIQIKLSLESSSDQDTCTTAGTWEEVDGFQGQDGGRKRIE